MWPHSAGGHKQSLKLFRGWGGNTLSGHFGPKVKRFTPRRAIRLYGVLRLHGHGATRSRKRPRALSLFAKDAVIVNVIGDTIESAQLPRFLELDMWLNESFALEQAAVERNRVTWTKAITAPFYEHIGVAPIRFAFAADVRNGKIDSIVAHVPLEEIVRIETACGRQTPEPRIYDKPCSAFIQRLAAQSAFATTAAAHDRVEMKVE